MISTNLRYLKQSFTRKKSLHKALREVGDAGSEHGGLKRCLTAFDLTSFGVGSMIGAGIFVITGKVAAEDAGPAITLSYLLAGTACALAALCYAELACRVPSSGSAYSYSYITIGEFCAWIIGWDLTLEYMIASSTVARGWSGYFKSLLDSLSVSTPSWLSPIHVSDGWGEGGIYLDPLAAFSVVLLTIILACGVKESIKLATVMVVVKVGVILFVVIAGSTFAKASNWDDFTPYGFEGISNGAAIIFFAYLGFDMVVNVAEETQNPQRDLPIGILGSLITGLVSQPRLYYSLSRDGLLPKWFMQIHPRFRTPFNATLFSGFFAAAITFVADINILSDMSSIGTLLAFSIVAMCTLIMRYTDPPIDPASSKDSGAESYDSPPANDGVELSNRNETTEIEEIEEATEEIQLDKNEGKTKEKETNTERDKERQKEEEEKEKEIQNDDLESIPPDSIGTRDYYLRNWHSFKKRHLETRSPVTLVVALIILSFISFICFRSDAPLAISIIFLLCAITPGIMMCFLKSKNIPTAFKCPGMPVVPVLSLLFNIYLMVNLSVATWIRLTGWLLIGLAIYFFYGIKHSNLSPKNYVHLDA